jgi:hypothetical protein
MVDVANQELRQRLVEAVGRLMSVRRGPGEKMLLDLPVVYPSGSSAVVDVEINGDKIWVSDMGMGHTEALMMGAVDSYQHVARGKAAEFGVGYDGGAMFVLWAPVERIEAAISCVANASAQAAADAVRLATEVRHRKQEDAIFEKVTRIFGNRSVTKSYELSGKRSSWEAHNVVRFPNGRGAIFEPMSKQHVSVSSKFLMFSDLREARIGFSLNAVVESIKGLDAKAQMVGDVANILELAAADEVFRQYGEAS